MNMNVFLKACSSVSATAWLLSFILLDCLCWVSLAVRVPALHAEKSSVQSSTPQNKTVLVQNSFVLRLNLAHLWSLKLLQHQFLSRIYLKKLLTGFSILL